MSSVVVGGASLSLFLVILVATLIYKEVNANKSKNSGLIINDEDLGHENTIIEDEANIPTTIVVNNAITRKESSDSNISSMIDSTDDDEHPIIYSQENKNISSS